MAISSCEPRIRVAAVADAARLAAVADRLFREAYAADYDAAEIDLHCANHYSERRQRDELSDAATRVLLVECDTEAIGFTQFCVQRPAAELRRFYISRLWHGRGIAQQLMTQVLQQARDAGAETIWLQVRQPNARAIAFYRKFGFDITRTAPFMLGTLVETDYIMERTL